MTTAVHLFTTLAAAPDPAGSVPMSWLVLLGLGFVILLMVLFGILAISATGRTFRHQLHQRRRANEKPKPIDPWTESGRRLDETPGNHDR